ncbi:class II aldolase/adducin family protein [Tardiphaga sp.]|uniref:class II aldolase/adducin family protein n=1 Tax=Tardiphaga sp. TaxID=1926292 RepID=UPI0025F5CA04|nr:class II aldolase/adducin family protein [Tardiphaga sp.]
MAKPDNMSDGEWQTRVNLAACYRLLAASGFHDLTYNHLSARVPDAPHLFLVKGDDQLFEQATASSLALYDFDGNQVRESPHKISRGGVVIHGGILEARPDLAAVFHTHSPANMGIAAQNCGLLPISQHAMLFYNCLSTHDFHGFEFDLASRKSLVDDLGSNQSMILRNHGALVCGRTVAEAFYLHHYFEMSCRSQIAALSIGGIDKLIIPSPDVCEHAARQMQSKGVVKENDRDWRASFAWAMTIAPDLAS